MKINHEERIGLRFPTKHYGEIEIIDCKGYYDCTIRFQDGTINYNVEFGSIVKGNVKNYNQPTLYGVGYLGYGKYRAYRKSIIYDKWRKILCRCYDEAELIKNPSYRGCEVDKKWHNFQNFAEWMTNKYNPDTMKRWELDKDILVKGNRVYSESTCCFVPKVINILFQTQPFKKSKLPLGITKNGKKYMVRISEGKNRPSLGNFSDLNKACSVYKQALEAKMKRVADEWKPLIEPEVYQAMYNYTVDYENI